MNFGHYFNAMPPQHRPPRLPRCIYCSVLARIGCNDCGSPMCGKHGTLEVDQYKCREHRKRFLPTGSTKGVLDEAVQRSEDVPRFCE
jgi:hypothetical protein